MFCFMLFCFIVDTEMEFDYITYNGWDSLGASDLPTSASKELRLQVLSSIPGVILIFYIILFVVVAIAAQKNELKSTGEAGPHDIGL